MKDLRNYIIKESSKSPEYKAIDEFYAKYYVMLSYNSVPHTISTMAFNFSETKRKSDFEWIENTGYDDRTNAVIYTLYQALKEKEDSETVAKHINDSKLGWSDWEPVKDNKALVHLKSKGEGYDLTIYRNDTIFKNIYKGFATMNDLNDEDFKSTVFTMLTEGTTMLGDRFINSIKEWIKEQK